MDVLFHYDSGNFEAHSSDGDGKFFAHHSLRVPPEDMIKVEVLTEENGKHVITAKHRYYVNKEEDKIYEVA